MQLKIERLRRWLLLGMLLLATSVVGFLGYAHYRARRTWLDLPHKLGMDIKSETNGFTYSQSVKGHTLFTIHASKAIQRQDGKTTLRDVSITLYGGAGKDKPGSDRQDHISGNEFEYDEQNGLIKAMGEVHIDLQAPAQTVSSSSQATSATASPAKDGRIHVKTSGLLFQRKLGVAVTDQPIDFYLNDTQGNAVGAEYDTESGILILRRDVQLHRKDKDGVVATLLASYAQIDRQHHMTHLQNAHYRSGDQTMAGDLLDVAMDDDGSPNSLHATGNIVMTDGDTMRVTSQTANAQLDPEHHPKTVHLDGGVHFTTDDATGTSDRADLQFDGTGHAQTLILLGKVHSFQTSGTQTREITSERAVIHLKQQGKRTVARTLDAPEGGTIVVRSTAGSNAGATTIQADVLQASITDENGTQYMDHMTGHGHAVFDQVMADGSHRRSTSDTLEAYLLPPSQSKTKQVGAASEPIRVATQTGSVVILIHTPADPQKKKNASDTKAYAQRAEYVGGSDALTLTGDPHIEGDGTYLIATHITMMRTSGDAMADGDVRASYDSGSQQGATHVLAQHAEMHHASNTAVFVGNAAHPARLWQGGSQMEAARIELDRTRQILHGSRGNGGQVKLAIVDSSGTKAAAPPVAKPDTKHEKVQPKGGTILMTGADVVYYGAGDSPVAHITGGVQAVQSGSTMKAQTLTATWKKTGEKAAGANADLFGGNLDTLQADGSVRLLQPGRTGTGERLLYTAATGEYQLTGTPALPPRIVDAVQGSITGASLIFHAGDDSVVVAAAPGNKVHAETRVRREK